MSDLVPPRFLFRFELPIHRLDPPPRIDGDLSDWPERCLLPELHKIDGRRTFADLWLGWHESGLYLACRVRSKNYAPRCDPQKFWKFDNLRLMTDMRDARDIRRATRFCQHFWFLPAGGGPDGRAPIAGSHRIERAMAHAPLVPSERIPIAAGRTPGGGYTLEAHLPADVLVGFGPADNPRIGFFTMVEDSEHGQQYLTVGDDLSWNYDPSTWATGVLCE